LEKTRLNFIVTKTEAYLSATRKMNIVVREKSDTFTLKKTMTWMLIFFVIHQNNDVNC